MTNPTHPRDVNRERVRKALRASFPENSERDLEEYGESIWLIACAQDIPIDALLFWIHDKPAAKDFSQKAWTVWCARYCAARDQLPPEATQTQPAAPEAQEPASQSAPAHALCTHCFAHVIQQIDQLWWCPRCGVVQP
jgi:hypothetical protein